MKPSTAATRLPRILIVDDMPDNLFLMQALLDEHYEVVQAVSGSQALQHAISANPPDLVLLDIMMPDMDGYEVMRRIRQHTPTATIPVIFLTALATPADELLGRDLGALDYLTKPVDPAELIRRVEAHVRATAHARSVEALSEKLARHLPADQWERLFHRATPASFAFEQKQQTVLFAEGGGRDALDECARSALAAEVEWLATRHGGSVDRFSDGAGVAFFDDPATCVRAAMELQRAASDLRLRIGVYTGVCDIAMFRIDYQACRTLIGREVFLAAQVGESAAIGSIVVSPETYVLVQDDIRTDTRGCLLMEEFADSDLAQVSLTPPPMSTFAGLGRN